jgi:hypothetical protein
MSKVIICGTTGTVVTLEDCYIVDTSMLSQPDLELLISDPTDSELSKLAEKTGKKLEPMLSAGNYGDVTYANSVSYSPLSLKDEAEVLIDIQQWDMYDEQESVKAALEWAYNKATVEELDDVSKYIMVSDDVWDGYKTNMIQGLMSYWYFKTLGKDE